MSEMVVTSLVQQAELVHKIKQRRVAILVLNSLSDQPPPEYIARTISVLRTAIRDSLEELGNYRLDEYDARPEREVVRLEQREDEETA